MTESLPCSRAFAESGAREAAQREATSPRRRRRHDHARSDSAVALSPAAARARSARLPSAPLPAPAQTLTALAQMRRAFPGQSFDGVSPNPGRLRGRIRALPQADRGLPPRQIVMVAVPDQLHFDVVMTALRHDQHVCCVKPLVLNARAGAGDRERSPTSAGWWSASSITSASTTAA